MAGRPERELADDGRAVTALARDLRALRARAGGLSYAELGRRAYRSTTTLSEAAGGVGVPTWETVAAYVRACGEDPADWRARWEAASAEARARAARGASSTASAGAPEQPPAGRGAQADVSAADPALPVPGTVPTRVATPAPVSVRGRGRRRARLRLVLLAVVVVAAVAAGVGLLRGLEATSPATAVSPPAPPSPTASSAGAPSVAVVDGSDPQDTGCARLPGVVVLDTTEVDYHGVPVGEAQLKYSPSCGASWPRFDPAPQGALPKGTVIETNAVRPDDGYRTDFSAASVGLPVFGNLVVSTTSCVVAEVSVYDPGEPAPPPARTHCFRGQTYVR